MKIEESCDCVIVGGGIDALICACYLSRSGCRTTLVAQQHEESPIGATGHSGSRAALTDDLLFRYGPAVHELNLRGHGLEYQIRPAVRVSLHPDGEHLVLTGRTDEVRRELRRLSPEDAGTYAHYFRGMRRLRRLTHRFPGAVTNAGTAGRAAELRQLLGRAASLSDRELVSAAAVLYGSARSVLDSWFESEHLKAFLAGEALSGARAGPSTQGSANLLLDQASNAPADQAESWLRCAGGWAGAHRAVHAAALAYGVRVRPEAQARRIVSGRDGLCTVELSDEGRIETRAVVHTLDPRSLLELLDNGVLPDDYRSALMEADFAGPFAEIRFRLGRLPRLKGRTGKLFAWSRDAQFSIGPTLDYLDSAHSQASRGALPLHPYIECRISSGDPVAGEEGAALHARVQYAPRDQAAWSWPSVGPAVTHRVLAALEPHLEGVSGLVEESWALSPGALEREALLRGEVAGRDGTLLATDPLLRIPAPGSRYGTPLHSLHAYGRPGSGTATAFGGTGRRTARLVLGDLGARDRTGGRLRLPRGGQHV